MGLAVDIRDRVWNQSVERMYAPVRGRLPARCPTPPRSLRHLQPFLHRLPRFRSHPTKKKNGWISDILRLKGKYLIC